MSLVHKRKLHGATRPIGDTPTALPPVFDPAAGARPHAAPSAYDGMRDPHLRWSRRPAAATPDPSAGVRLPPAGGRTGAVTPGGLGGGGGRVLAPLPATLSSSGGPLAASAAQRLRAQRAAYDRVLSHRLAALELLPGRDPNTAGKSGQQLRDEEDNQVRPDEVFVTARSKLLHLWDELRIDAKVREHFEATAFRDVSAESIAAMHAEIARLVSLRVAERDVLKAVEVREGFLYLLMDAAEKVDAACRELAALPLPTPQEAATLDPAARVVAS